MESSKPKPAKTTYQSLNTLKGLACIGVVYLHCSFPGAIGKSLLYALKFAVPVFFMISGFFLLSADKCNTSVKIKRQLIKIVKILLVSVLIYALFDLVCSLWIVHSADSLGTWLQNSMPTSLLLLTRQIVFGTFFNNTLWYFHALIFAYLLIGPIIRHISPRWIVLMIIMLFIIHIASRLYVRAMDYQWYEANYWRSFLLTGLPWMLTGYVIAYYRDRICQRLTFPILIGVILLSYFVQNFEYKLYHQSLSFYFSTIIYSISLFILGIKYPQKKVSGVLNSIGAKISLEIYIVHYAILVVINDITPRNAIITDWTAPILSITISILVALLFKCASYQINKFKTDNK